MKLRDRPQKTGDSLKKIPFKRDINAYLNNIMS